MFLQLAAYQAVNCSRPRQAKLARMASRANAASFDAAAMGKLTIIPKKNGRCDPRVKRSFGPR